MSERKIPEGLSVVKQTPTWDADNVPEALLANHQADTWAELCVEQGAVTFVEPANELHGAEYIEEVTPIEPCVIVPKVEHYIKPSEDAMFFLRFYGQGE